MNCCKIDASNVTSNGTSRVGESTVDPAVEVAGGKILYSTWLAHLTLFLTWMLYMFKVNLENREKERKASTTFTHYRCRYSSNWPYFRALELSPGILGSLEKRESASTVMNHCSFRMSTLAFIRSLTEQKVKRKFNSPVSQ